MQDGKKLQAYFIYHFLGQNFANFDVKFTTKEGNRNMFGQPPGEFLQD